MRSWRLSVLLFAVFTLVAGLAPPAAGHPEGPAHHAPHPPHATEVMRAFAADQQEPPTSTAQGPATCTDGFAGVFPCRDVDLLAHLPLPQIGGTSSSSKANDIWGWTDPVTGQEYAIVGRVFGTSFVDITEPTAPVYLGQLPAHGAFGSSWRDIKVYADHAFVVSESLNHGMQVFNLTQLRTMDRTSLPVTFAETAHYSGNASAHNIVVNEDTGYAYIVGASGKQSCSGGLHIVDIRTPTSPTFAGCYSADGYTHDAQCVVYAGPDTAHRGREICLNSNEDTVTVVDVTDKTAPVMLSRTGYLGSEYTHQGWLTDDQRHFLVDDELDEDRHGHNTRTYVWDVSDLDAPVLTGSFDGTTTAIDHNQYVRGRFSYQANYRAGLRIIHFDDLGVPSLEEVAYFDVYPADDAAEFNGAWSNYPYFDSGVVIVSGIEQGLFVLRPHLPATGTAAVADFDGDGDTDPAVFRPSNAGWYVHGQPPRRWGQPGDVPVPGDYDGDGDTDLAVWTPATGRWRIQAGTTVRWGRDGDVPVPADYDGDGDTDIALWSPSTGTWRIHGRPRTNWGAAGDVPVPGDYDGDGTADIAVFRPPEGTWLIRGRPDTAWGRPGDVPAPADHDGDGDTDIAVFRPTTGTWHVLGGSKTAWGAAGDVPVPGDYAGDGTADLAVWRPTAGRWYVQGQPPASLGEPTDIPLTLPWAIWNHHYG